MQAVTVDELEVQFSSSFRREWDHADLLARLANRRLQRSFTGFDFTSRRINFSRPEPALLANEKQTIAFTDEAKIGALSRSPEGPVHRGS